MHDCVTEPLVVLIDGPHLHRALAAVDFQLDFRKFLGFCRSRGRLLQARFYAPADAGWRSICDWLSYNGYVVGCAFPEGSAHRRERNSIATQLTADALALPENVQHIILVSGDSQLSVLVRDLKRTGRRVTVLSTLREGASLVADPLRRSADDFIELADLSHLVALQPQAHSSAGEHDGLAKKQHQSSVPSRGQRQNAATTA